MKGIFIALAHGLTLFIFLSLGAQAAPPELMLLSRYQSDMPITGWLMSEKLDGVRAYWDGNQLLTRQGNPLHAPDGFTENFPPFELDGELWMGRGQYQQTQSITSRHKPSPDWDRIGYYVFEAPHSPGGLEARLRKLADYLDRNPVAHLHIIPQTPCQGTDHLMQRMAEVEQQGGEGLVLRNPQTPYQTGRSADALKVKRFDDMEGTVIGYRPGMGKYQGQTGALWIEIVGGLRFYIGSGLSDRDRMTPPPIGSVISFKYQGTTRSGIPRFASFIRVRADY